MGYFTRADLAFYYALADAFTICDALPLLGARPDRPEPGHVHLGHHRSGRDDGGPVLETFGDRWPTTGSSVGDDARAAAGRRGQLEGLQRPDRAVGLSPFPYFKAFDDRSTRPGRAGRPGADPGLPGIVRADVAAGTLPSVSWIMPPLAECEHPAAPPDYGEYLVQQILKTLFQPRCLGRTVFIVIYDENGGFFDHVPRPRPRGDRGGIPDRPAAAEASGIAGPSGSVSGCRAWSSRRSAGAAT